MRLFPPGFRRDAAKFLPAPGDLISVRRRQCPLPTPYDPSSKDLFQQHSRPNVSNEKPLRPKRRTIVARLWWLVELPAGPKAPATVRLCPSDIQEPRDWLHGCHAECLLRLERKPATSDSKPPAFMFGRARLEVGGTRPRAKLRCSRLTQNPC